ncbi:hypothetical protein [Botryobacter ruber]|uniref:hypothetical protein n=1 Tax=Botryobacter ruber TaxID=2171629 RepID=UPI000E0B9766|nr:hypothetical protein [Botryobacter ruber]
MKPEELDERLADAERVLALHSKRLEQLEKQEAPKQQEPEPQEYNSHFEELKAILKRYDFSIQALQIYAQINSFRDTISKLPKVLPVRHHHHFEDRSRGLLIGGIILLIITAVSVGLSFSLYRENSKLQENDMKYRMIRQSYPKVTLWADTTYQHDPVEAEKWVEQIEVK